MGRAGYVHGCLLVRSAGETLGCPTTTIVMALEMLQRFASRVPAVAEDRIFQRDLAAACLFLASKADEHTLKTNDLLNTVHHLDGSPLEAVPLAVQLFPDLFAGKQDDGHATQAERTERAASAPGAPSSEAPEARGGFLVAEDYYLAKDVLLKNEQRVLQVLGFDLESEQPHKYALNLCMHADLSPACAQLACALATDLMTMSDISPRVKPESLGIGAVVAATEILGVPCVRLAERTGADLAEVARVCQEVAALASSMTGVG